MLSGRISAGSIIIITAMHIGQKLLLPLMIVSIWNAKYNSLHTSESIPKVPTIIKQNDL
jgi:hypothetical protein